MLAGKDNAHLAAHLLRKSGRNAQGERDLVYLAKIGPWVNEKKPSPAWEHSRYGPRIRRQKIRWI